MKNSYKKIMEQVSVAPEMEARILMRLDAEPSQPPVRRPVFTRSSILRGLSIAACLTLVVCAARLLPPASGPEIIGSEPGVMIGNPWSDYADQEQLEAALSFDLRLPRKLPDGFAAYAYSAILPDTAQVIYADGENRLTYQMTAGDIDLSSSHGECDRHTEAVVGNTCYHLTGSEGKYLLIWWSDGEFTYCIDSALPMEMDALVEMAENVS